MTIGAATHLLNTTVGKLEVTYQVCHTKIQNAEITFALEDIPHRFQLSQIWINGLPAHHLKGFKAKIIKDDSPFRAEVKEGKLYLFSDSFEQFKVRVQYESKKYLVPVSQKLRVSGFYELIKDGFHCTNFQICNTKTKRSLQGPYTLVSCGIDTNDSFTIVRVENPDIILEQQNSGKEPNELGDGIGVASRTFVNFEEVEYIEFDDKASEWRYIEKGLNLEGLCVDPKCKAFNLLVCDPKEKMGEYNMHEACVKAECPICGHTLKNVTNCIFWDCIYSIEGKQEGKSEFYRQDNKQAPKDRGLSFAEVTDGQSNLVDWEYLKITVAKVPSRWFL